MKRFVWGSHVSLCPFKTTGLHLNGSGTGHLFLKSDSTYPPPKAIHLRSTVPRLPRVEGGRRTAPVPNPPPTPPPRCPPRCPPPRRSRSWRKVCVRSSRMHFSSRHPDTTSVFTSLHYSQEAGDKSRIYVLGKSWFEAHSFALISPGCSGTPSC